MKWVIRIVVLIVLVFLVWGTFFKGDFIKRSVNTLGPKALGVPVSVQNVDISLIKGIVYLQNLKIGNPEGFDTENLFTMESINVCVKMSSLFSDTIVIEKIEILGPEITYERNITDSNIGVLQKQLAGDGKDKQREDEETEKKPEKKKDGKKVVIDYFVLDDCQVNVSLPGMGGASAPLPLPKVEMKDIGKGSEEGASIIDVIENIFSSIFAAVGDVVLGSGKLLGSGAKQIGSGAILIGGAAVDGAAAVGGAAVGGVKAVGKGVAGLFGGGSDDDEGKATESKEAEK